MALTHLHLPKLMCYNSNSVSKNRRHKRKGGDKMAQLLTTKEVAERLNLNASTITYYIRTKQLPAMKLGRSYQISETDLLEFLESRKTIQKEVEK